MKAKSIVTKSQKRKPVAPRPAASREALIQIHDKLFEAQSVLDALYRAQYAEDMELDPPDELNVAHRCGAVKVAHDILTEVHALVDELKSEKPKIEATPAEARP